jgi:hypothetical protein
MGKEEERRRRRNSDGTASSVRRFVNNQAYGTLFCTRDCLNLGPRSSIDQTLYELVKDGTIMRMARGVFARMQHDTPWPTIGEIAAAKAKAFGRRILMHGKKALTKAINGVTDLGHPHVYAIDGRSSSFHSVQGRVRFKQYAPRILKHSDKPHGLVIRALWELGKREMTDELIRDITNRLGRIEMADLRRSCAQMPEWMANLVAFSLGVRSINN